MAVPGLALKWQVLSHAGTNIRFVLVEGEAVRAFWHQCGTLRESSCGLLPMDGAFGGYQGACAN